MFADKPGQLQQRGMNRRSALMLLANKTTVSIEGEWLEAFWCDQCQQTKWYYIRKCNGHHEVSIAPSELWQQVTGVIDPRGNPCVGEFTRRQAKHVGYHGIKDFKFFR